MFAAAKTSQSPYRPRPRAPAAPISADPAPESAAVADAVLDALYAWVDLQSERRRRRRPPSQRPSRRSRPSDAGDAAGDAAPMPPPPASAASATAVLAAQGWRLTGLDHAHQLALLQRCVPRETPVVVLSGALDDDAAVTDDGARRAPWAPAPIANASSADTSSASAIGAAASWRRAVAWPRSAAALVAQDEAVLADRQLARLYVPLPRAAAQTLCSHVAQRLGAWSPDRRAALDGAVLLVPTDTTTRPRGGAAGAAAAAARSSPWPSPWPLSSTTLPRLVGLRFTTRSTASSAAPLCRPIQIQPLSAFLEPPPAAMPDHPTQLLALLLPRLKALTHGGAFRHRLDFDLSGTGGAVLARPDPAAASEEMTDWLAAAPSGDPPAGPATAAAASASASTSTARPLHGMAMASLMQAELRLIVETAPISAGTLSEARIVAQHLDASLLESVVLELILPDEAQQMRWLSDQQRAFRALRNATAAATAATPNGRDAVPPAPAPRAAPTTAWSGLLTGTLALEAELLRHDRDLRNQATLGTLRSWHLLRRLEDLVALHESLQAAAPPPEALAAFLDGRAAAFGSAASAAALAPSLPAGELAAFWDPLVDALDQPGRVPIPPALTPFYPDPRLRHPSVRVAAATAEGEADGAADVVATNGDGDDDGHDDDDGAQDVIAQLFEEMSEDFSWQLFDFLALAATPLEMARVFHHVLAQLRDGRLTPKVLSNHRSAFAHFCRDCAALRTMERYGRHGPASSSASSSAAAAAAPVTAASATASPRRPGGGAAAAALAASSDVTGLIAALHAKRQRRDADTEWEQAQSALAQTVAYWTEQNPIEPLIEMGFPRMAHFYRRRLSPFLSADQIATLWPVGGEPGRDREQLRRLRICQRVWQALQALRNHLPRAPRDITTRLLQSVAARFLDGDGDSDDDGDGAPTSPDGPPVLQHVWRLALPPFGTATHGLIQACGLRHGPAQPLVPDPALWHVQSLPATPVVPSHPLRADPPAGSSATAAATTWHLWMVPVEPDVDADADTLDATQTSLASTAIDSAVRLPATASATAAAAMAAASDPTAPRLAGLWTRPWTAYVGEW